jgi:hypothetical protein
VTKPSLGLQAPQEGELIFRTMKTAQFILLIAAGLALVIGCSAINKKPGSTSLRISGTPGAAFTAKYTTGDQWFVVHSIVQTNWPSSVLLRVMPGKAFACDVSKKDPEDMLALEVLHGNEPVFRADAPAGAYGVRITHTGAGWETERY